METKTVYIPEKTITFNKNTRKEHLHTFPATYHTYYPTLAHVYNWLWGDCGPITMPWKDGLLCSFDDRVHRMNITCSAGARKSCGGILVTPTNAPYPPHNRHRLFNRVVCFCWGNILSIAAWEVPLDSLITLPDNPELVAQFVMKHMFTSTHWLEWRRELRLRLQGKRKSLWLKPIL